MKRAKLRGQKDPAYKKFGAWVRAIRDTLNMSQEEFAKHLKVSSLTIRRWELGWGHYPKPVYMRLLKQMGDNCEGLRKLNIRRERE